MKRAGIFLITVALIAGMAGCGSGPGQCSGQCSLTIHCTEGGRLLEPGVGTFSYDYGTVVYLYVEADLDDCYVFVNWTGDVGTIADVEATYTTITMHGSYVITANFAPKVSENLEIWDWYDLDAVRDNRCGNHTLMNDLDSTTPGYEELAGPMANRGRGWEPIGFAGDCSSFPFKGTFDGQGHEIHDLFIHSYSWFSELGLFGLSGGVIKNIGVVNATLVGVDSWYDGYVGALVGYNWGTVSNSYSTGSVKGNENYGRVGGLVGGNSWWGTVSDSYSAASVTGDRNVGGLVGENFRGTVSNSYSTGSVTGNSSIGGLVGDNDEGTVSNSYSTGSVTGEYEVGGLVGDNYEGTVSNSYSSGSVTGDVKVGGLVGRNKESTVSDCYSTGNVIGNFVVGGLAGYNPEGTLNNCYSTGNVTGEGNVGGLMGANDGYVSNSFWDTETSGQATSDGGTGKTTTQMKRITTFSGAGWDIIAVANPGMRNPSYIWNIVDDETYPFLSWQP